MRTFILLCTLLAFTNSAYLEEEHEIPLVPLSFGVYGIEVSLNGVKGVVFIDSGAATNFMPSKVLDRIGGVKTEDVRAFISANGESMHSAMYLVSTIRISDCTFKWAMFAGVNGPIGAFGLNTLERLGPVTLDFKKKSMRFRCPTG